MGEVQTLCFIISLLILHRIKDQCVVDGVRCKIVRFKTTIKKFIQTLFCFSYFIVLPTESLEDELALQTTA